MASMNLSTSVAPAVGQVGGHAAGADVVVVHPQAGDLLEDPQALLAVAPAVDHHRHRADVHAVGGEEQQVGRHPVQLGDEHADPLRPLGDVLVDAEQLLGGERERQLVEERRGVVHAGDVRGALEVGEVLTRLLHAGVQVADDRLRAQHGLALELEHEAQHAVGAGVLRTHVDDHGLVVGRALAHRCRRPRPSDRRSSRAQLAEQLGGVARCAGRSSWRALVATIVRAPRRSPAEPGAVDARGPVRGRP